MKLRRLVLQGFKSFADRTELHFHEGITAIVGPNGCGKSNVSDAIRWVLGEQRASAIRGSKMEEAIFQGTVQRRPLNRAEVAMTFDNADGLLPLPQNEVEIRRVVFREGGSDYLLNRQSVRLRDIFDICRDTGLGANAYTVIEQGMVDRILSDRPDDRRHMFEEAAGIGRYKDRRKSAQRRLEAAESDLARLEDLVAEVESKVRSLARQRGKAKRYEELRARRLALEVTVAGAELEQVRDTIERTTSRLANIEEEDPSSRAALSTAEAELERRRLESAEASRQRNTAAAKLEELARLVAEREREIAIADERRAHAERRLEQIAAERDERTARLDALAAELESLETEHGGQQGIVESLAGRVAEVQERQSALRQQVTDVRRADEEARSREAELARSLARLEADAAGAEARGNDALHRVEELGFQRDDLDAELSRLDQQGDLFAEHSRTLADQLETLRTQHAEAEEELQVLRRAEQEARDALAAADAEASRLASQAAALETLEREHHGFAPIVAAAMDARGDLTGVLGPVAEFLHLPVERASGVESALNSLLQALVVRDPDARQRFRDWFAAQENPHGTVALLPQEALPRLEALLDVIEFVGEPAAEPVLIGRRERLQERRAAAERAEAERTRRADARTDAAETVAAAEAALRELKSRMDAVELDLRRASADEANRSGQHVRVTRAREELERRHGELLAQVEKARADAEQARAQRAGLEEELVAHRAGWQEATRTLADREQAWEEVRDEEAELRVAHARAEGALTALERRLAAARDEQSQIGQRLESLEREEAGHRESIEQLGTRRGEAAERLEEMFAQRDEVAVELRGLDDALAEAADSAVALETQVRTLRRAADERSELRHRLDIQRTEAQAAERRVRERLEAEWGRPLEELMEEGEIVDGDPDVLRAELQAIGADIERLGPINMLAVEEHAEESQRLEFLQAQRDDLTKAKDDLQSAIRQINRTAKELFEQTFEQIRQNFRTTFTTLFEGGECDIRLEDPDDPLESPIDIAASPRGKRTQRIHLLSGGERALTALALLFAIYLVKPSPFCVLDEVDAPLDEANIGRFISMLKEFKKTTQFIVITHNPRTMESADWLYGVTMEDPGISSIVGVKLDEVLAGAGNGVGNVA
ncbi:MAG: AAA family ATPase [Longimicrobiales bacterium]